MDIERMTVRVQKSLNDAYNEADLSKKEIALNVKLKNVLDANHVL